MHSEDSEKGFAPSFSENEGLYLSADTFFFWVAQGKVSDEWYLVGISEEDENKKKVWEKYCHSKDSGVM